MSKAICWCCEQYAALVEWKSGCYACEECASLLKAEQEADLKRQQEQEKRRNITP